MAQIQLWDILSGEEVVELIRTKTEASTEPKLVARTLLGSGALFCCSNATGSLISTKPNHYHSDFHDVFLLLAFNS